jgi:hypothetical protein
MKRTEAVLRLRSTAANCRCALGCSVCEQLVPESPIISMSFADSVFTADHALTLETFPHFGDCMKQNSPER